jgi:radical SAM superfamily enzyme YgiQ (UPF0313 family)
VSVIYAGVGVAGFKQEEPRNDREGVLVGHGVGSIVASTKKAGFEVDFLDMRKLSGWDDFEKAIQADNNEVYGLSVSAVDYGPALKAITIIKTLKPKAKVIVGGIHPSIQPEMYDFKAIDTVVKGEGEITFPILLKQIENGIELPRYIVGEKPNLNRIPWVDREIFPYLDKEMDFSFSGTERSPAVTMLAGRGCPYHCKYCQPGENAVFGTPHRMRSPENVMAELYHLYAKYNFNSITFWDDTFTLDKKWIMRFADLYKQSKIGGQIAACTRADLVCKYPEVMERLAEIGVNWLVIGMETGSQRMLDLIGKGTTVKQNLKAAEICKRYGINVFATIMFGLPTETNEEVDQTLAMLDKMQPKITSPFWYIPIPGTALYDYCAKEKLILNTDKLEQTIERTGKFRPTLRNVDYEYLRSITDKYMIARNL